MQYLFFFIVMWAAIFLTIYTILPVFIILFFSIPFTIRLRKIGVVKNYKPIQRNLLSVLILGLVFVIAGWAVGKYTHYQTAFIFGAIIALIFSIKSIGENESNVKEYFENNEDCLDKQKVDELYKKSL